jgi:hypothetical protein
MRQMTYNVAALAAEPWNILASIIFESHESCGILTNFKFMDKVVSNLLQLGR